MAEILTRLIDGMDGHDKGDPVWVAEDDHLWGRKESLAVWLAQGHQRADWPGVFVIIKMPRVAAADLKFLQAPEGYDYEFFSAAKGGIVKTQFDVSARKHRIDIDAVPSNAQEDTAMRRDAEIEVTQTHFNTRWAVKSRNSTRENEAFQRIKARNPAATRP